MSTLNYITIQGQKLELPLYLPDATRAVIKSIDSEDIKQAGIRALMVNAYHLMQEPGATVLKALGGVKKFMHWDGLVASDSGGFQILSLLYSHKSLGKIHDDGIILRRKNKKYYFTPEKSIEIQFTLGTDIMICLDDCPKAKAKREDIAISVERTLAWAKRCKAQWEQEIKNRKIAASEAPLLLAVVQGGKHKDLREKCAQGLVEIGFPGYAFGGWPIDAEGNFDYETLRYTASLMPPERLKFALGIGNPEAIAAGFAMGYEIFDCVLPTRDGRHKRLYIFNQDPQKIDFSQDKNFYDYLYIAREKYVRDQEPISKFCDCPVCRHYSRAYLHHLFKIKDMLAGRLATIHNLRMYSTLMENLKCKNLSPRLIRLGRKNAK